MILPTIEVYAAPVLTPIDFPVHLTRSTMEPGEYVNATLPPEGLNTVTWTESGEFAIFWNNDTEQISFNPDVKYKPPTNAITGAVKVVCQRAGTYWCICPIRLTDPAIIGSLKFCKAGGGRTAMPGQSILMASGEYIVDGVTIKAPYLVHADTESVTVSCTSEGYCPRIEFIDNSEIAARYDDEV